MNNPEQENSSSLTGNHFLMGFLSGQRRRHTGHGKIRRIHHDVFLLFLAEMGDKTQIATVTLAANYPSPLIVTIGTTVGMLLSNALAIFLGSKLLNRIPMLYVRIFASILFALFGVGILMNYQQINSGGEATPRLVSRESSN